MLRPPLQEDGALLFLFRPKQYYFLANKAPIMIYGHKKVRSTVWGASTRKRTPFLSSARQEPQSSNVQLCLCPRREGTDICPGWRHCSCQPSEEHHPGIGPHRSGVSCQSKGAPPLPGSPDTMPFKGSFFHKQYDVKVEKNPGSLRGFSCHEGLFIDSRGCGHSATQQQNRLDQGVFRRRCNNRPGGCRFHPSARHGYSDTGSPSR